ncbi:MAG: HEAT repeat domain-containing protein, partial [Kiritimatiellae bacterium]|nr:HEAT repeat domain-containing protein [Kiritimatiellia bacterium]
ADRKHPITMDLPEKFLHAPWDHLLMLAGPAGSVLMQDNAGQPLLVVGTLGAGRAALCGFDFPKDEGATAKLFVNIVKWLGEAGPKKAADGGQIDKAVELKVLRREKVWDYTHLDRGFDRNPGIIPGLKIEYEAPLDVLGFKLDDFTKYASSAAEKAELTALKQRQAALAAQLETSYQSLVADITARINALGLEQLKSLPADFQEEALKAKLTDPVKIEALQKDVTAIAAKYDQRRQAQKQQAAADELKRDAAAVPGLIASLQDISSEVRARAAMELGRIGDERAAAALITAIDDKAYEVARNAIYALGWMQAKDAGPALIKAADSKNKWIRRRATQALGLIGDKSAVAKLEQLSKDADAFVAENAGFALQWIKAGGVKQPDFMKLSGNFYWMNNRYHALYGRHFVYFGNPPREAEPTALYMEDGAGTGTITGGREAAFQKLGDTEFRKYLDALADRDLKWLGDLAATNENMAINKQGCYESMARWSDAPAFAGFWKEESHRLIKEPGDDPYKNYLPAFRDFLMAKYGKQKLAGHGISDLAQVKIAKENSHDFVWAEFMDFTCGTLMENWQEGAEWIHAFRKGTFVTFSTSEGTFPRGHANYFAFYPSLGNVIDVHGPESYASHSTACMLQADMARDGKVRPVMVEFYQAQAPDNDWIEKGYAASYFHGECYFVWQWSQVFKHPADRANAIMWGWAPGRWEVSKRAFSKGKQLSDYLAGTDSPKNVALLYSGRTSDLIYGTAAFGGGRGRRYFQNQLGVYSALLKSQIPFDVIWCDTLTEAKLGRYKTALLIDGKSLTKQQSDMISNWVNAGGVLIASGTTTLFDEWNTRQSDYALGDVFGVKYVQTAPGTALDMEQIYKYADRDVKPAKVGALQITAATPLLAGMKAGDVVEYDMAAGYDVVKPTKGTVVATWKEGGEPAIVVNDFGKGKSVFLSAIYPGLSATTLGATVHNLDMAFWPGAKELIAGAVKGAAMANGAALPARATNCRENVELSVRTQDNKKRWMVHLFDFGPKRVTNSGVQVEVRCPWSPAEVNVYYPYPARQDVEFKAAAGGGITFTVRDFDIHEMVVIEEK